MGWEVQHSSLCPLEYVRGVEEEGMRLWRGARGGEGVATSATSELSLGQAGTEDAREGEERGGREREKRE